MHAFGTADGRRFKFTPEGGRITLSVGGQKDVLLIPRSDRKRVYALLSSVPAVLLYLVLLAYMYFGNLEPLADGVLLASVIGGG